MKNALGFADCRSISGGTVRSVSADTIQMADHPLSTSVPSLQVSFSANYLLTVVKSVSGQSICPVRAAHIRAGVLPAILGGYRKVRFGDALALGTAPLLRDQRVTEGDRSSHQCSKVRTVCGVSLVVS